MPKINVYLPDDLADSVRESGVPVSAICQRALEQSVKRVAAARAGLTGDLGGADPTAALTQFTQRAKDALTLAIGRARDRGVAEVGTADLLHGLLSEGGNLALSVLGALEIDPATALRAVERATVDTEVGTATRMSQTAINALELSVVEALVLGHNYVGCEHLLLGLLGEPDGTGGHVLRGLGAETKSARQVVTAALSGYQHLWANQASTNPVVALINTALEPVRARLAQLEERIGQD